MRDRRSAASWAHVRLRVLRVLDSADAVLAGVDRFTAEAIGSPEAAQLKLISRWGVGFDAIDVAAATDAGIVVAYTPGLLNETVADFAFALLLALARHVHLGHGDMTNGTWRAVWGVEVFGKTIGLVGLWAHRPGDGAPGELGSTYACSPTTWLPTLQRRSSA